MSILDHLDSAALQAPRPARTTVKVKKARSKSCTQRSVEKLEADGYLVARVEQTIPHTFIKRDMFGFGDLLAIRRGEVLVVQVTDHTNISKRVAKITEHENVGRVREAGIRIEVHGWDGERVRIVDLS